MRNSQRVKELEAKTQKSVHKEVKLYYCKDGVYTTADDGRVISLEEIEKVSCDNSMKIIVNFV